jgi:GNAT superfamily N-acetyltransferase
MGIAKVLVDTWRTAFAGIVPQDYLDSMSYSSFEERLTANFGSRFTVVAQNDDGQVVGFASGGAIRDEEPPFKGELYSIFVRDEYQGMRLGRKMVSHVADHLIKTGINDMIVWVLQDNPSRRFYELLNGEFHRERDIEIGGKALKEVSYVWKDLHALL